MIIRPEKPGDTADIRYLNEQAFDRPAEAQLVDTLRARGRIILSLVAVRNDHVVGHILFSPVTIETERAALPVAGLAPMAIVPTLQRQGIGSLLVKAGLDACRKTGLAGVVVLGHPFSLLRRHFSKYQYRRQWRRRDWGDENYAGAPGSPGVRLDAGESGG